METKDTEQTDQFLAPYNEAGIYHHSFYNINELKYYPEFDNIKNEDGSYDLLKLDFPYVLLSHAEWQEALSGQYKVVDGIHTYIAPAPPTAEEIKQQALTALDTEYEPRFTQLSQALGMATLSDNTDLITSIKADYTALKIEYDGKREVIING